MDCSLCARKLLTCASQQLNNAALEENDPADIALLRGYTRINYTPPACYLKQSITLNFHFIIKIKSKMQSKRLDMKCWFCIQLPNTSWENLSLPPWLFLFNIQAWNGYAHFKLLRKEEKLKTKEKRKAIPIWMQNSKEEQGEIRKCSSVINAKK